MTRMVPRKDARSLSLVGVTSPMKRAVAAAAALVDDDGSLRRSIIRNIRAWVAR